MVHGGGGLSGESGGGRELEVDQLCAGHPRTRFAGVDVHKVRS